MTILGESIEAIAQDEFNNPSSNFGDVLDDFVVQETQGQSIGLGMIQLFNDWQNQLPGVGWSGFMRWIWQKIKEFVNWLWDLIQ